MENSEWRSMARGIAWIDIVFSCGSLFVAIILVVVAGMSTGTEEHEADWWLKLLIVFLILQLWAGSELLSATQKDLNVEEALQRANVWRFVTVTLLIMNLSVRIFFLQRYVHAAIDFVVRGFFLVIVHKFMRDLQQVFHDLNRISVYSI